MSQQVQELKTTVAQLRASQAQMAREFAKASEAKAAETRPAEQNQGPKVSALTPPPAGRPAARAQAEAGLFLFACADCRRSRSAAPAGASRRAVTARAAQANDRR